MTDSMLLMMPTWLAQGTDNNTILMVVLAAVAIGAIVYSLIPRKNESDEEILRRMAGKKKVETSVPNVQRSSAIKKALEGRVGQKIGGLVATDVKENTRIRSILIAAGYRSKEAFTIFMAAKAINGVLFMGIGLTLFFTIGANTDMMKRLLYLGGAFAVGFMGPNFILEGQMKARQKKIRNGLPDALDLMVVCVEAGLGLDSALQRVSDEMRYAHPILCGELATALAEQQLGVPRSQALTNMAQRTGVDELRNLVSMIVQAEKFGTSVAKALRTQAQVMRVKRRQRAEEKAAQCAVKLLFPLIFFIFPALFVVLAGPGGLSIYETFVKNK